MRNPRDRRRTAPGRQGSADHRFKPGHDKLGGRKRGTPNKFSADYRKAILEAAFRIGMGGNGEDGLIGYFRWLARYHAPTFMMMLARLLPWEYRQGETPVPAARTPREINESIRLRYGLDKNRRIAPVEPWSAWDWTGEGDPLGPLMQCAVEDPGAFCRLFIAAFLPLPTARHRRARAL